MTFAPCVQSTPLFVFLLLLFLLPTGKSAYGPTRRIKGRCSSNFFFFFASLFISFVPPLGDGAECRQAADRPGMSIAFVQDNCIVIKFF